MWAEGPKEVGQHGPVRDKHENLSWPRGVRLDKGQSSWLQFLQVVCACEQHRDVGLVLALYILLWPWA